MKRFGLSVLSRLCRGLRLSLSLLLALAGVAMAQATATADQMAQARGGVVLLTPDNIRPASPGGRRLARIGFTEPAAMVLGPQKNETAHQMLRRLVSQGLAAGNHGDLYENRDRGHARFSPEAYPQLTHVLYDDRLREQGLDHGLPLRMLFDAPVIGNASLALTSGPAWRSLPRLALTMNSGAGVHRLYQNYLSGQIHVFPEHHDHDLDRGDLLPANTPYMLISQGSSGSDLPHLEALAMILAAFRPETKAALREAGLVAPTVQMVYRRARTGVRSRAAYLSGAAHPSVFRAGDIDLARMVGLANSIAPDEVPPLVRLNVLEETGAKEGIDYFGEGLSEVLFDTPSAIARIWRSRAGRRSMVVTAADTRDPNGRVLTFDWVVLRGDPGRVRITPLIPDGRYAHIEVDWQDARAAPGAPDILSRRIDIGVFANNGIHDSAPAFISILLPRHENRVYEAGPGGEPRSVSINRARVEAVYTDPELFPDMPWRDDYRYDATGQPVGWTRHRPGQVTEYDATGLRIQSRGGQNGPVVTAPVRYSLEPGEDGQPRVREALRDALPEPLPH